MACSTSVFLSSKQRVLNKQQVGDLIARLETLDHGEMIKSIKEDVDGGHHLNFFPDRRATWSAVILDRNFELFVSSVINKYITLMRQCCDGREKYSNLLVNWMELERTTLHEVDSPTHKEWSQIEKRVSLSLSDATRSAIVTSLMRAVFNRCQQAVVSFKEGETLLLEGEQCDADDEFVEAGLDIDEACLYCLGGYALHSAIEVYTAPTKSAKRQYIHSILVCMRLPIEDKTGLPSNIQHLDVDHCMTFMKKEMLGYLYKVCGFHTMCHTSAASSKYFCIGISGNEGM